MPATLAQVQSFIEAQSYAVEALVVENGSQDRTLQIAQDFAQKYPNFRVISEQARGKGLAVRRGMLAAQGEYRFMCDADFSMPAVEINRFLPPALTGVNIAIASREAPGAVRYNEPRYRHLVGRVFNTLIRILTLPDLHDTQCGFKCFRGDVAEDLFRRQTITGWSFDVEVLFIARRLGYSIVEVPIPWFFNPDSKVSVLRDSVRMALDLIDIRRKAIQGVYDRIPLQTS